MAVNEQSPCKAPSTGQREALSLITECSDDGTQHFRDCPDDMVYFHGSHLPTLALLRWKDLKHHSAGIIYNIAYQLTPLHITYSRP